MLALSRTAARRAGPALLRASGVPASSLPDHRRGVRGVKTTASGQWLEGELGMATELVHAGVEPDPRTGAVLSPIFYSTTFVQESVDKYLEKGFSYSRSGNPTVRALEERIAALKQMQNTPVR